MYLKYFVVFITDMNVEDAIVKDYEGLSEPKGHTVKGFVQAILDESMQATHCNGMAKAWRKALLGLAQMVLKEELTIRDVDGTGESDSMYHVQLIYQTFHQIGMRNVVFVQKQN